MLTTDIVTYWAIGHTLPLAGAQSHEEEEEHQDEEDGGPGDVDHASYGGDRDSLHWLWLHHLWRNSISHQKLTLEK